MTTERKYRRFTPEFKRGAVRQMSDSNKHCTPHKRGSGLAFCPLPHRWLPGAEFIGNLDLCPTKGAKEWPDLSDWSLPARFITSQRVVINGVRVVDRVWVIGVR